MMVCLQFEREVYHVLPTNDLKPHVEKGLRCWCKPRIEQFENGNMVVTHNSADGREFYEEEPLKGH
jgi:hypothetical protein